MLFAPKKFTLQLLPRPRLPAITLASFSATLPNRPSIRHSNGIFVPRPDFSHGCFYQRLAANSAIYYPYQPRASPRLYYTNYQYQRLTNQGFSTSLPSKLVKKTLDLEFVDMAELMPDAWQPPEDENPKCCHQPCRVPKRGPVTDILLWVEYFSIMAGILTTKYPERAPDLFAYQKNHHPCQSVFFRGSLDNLRPLLSPTSSCN